MVLPTPFERLLQETVQLANRDPNAAFARLDELYGKTQTENEVLQLGSFAVHLGATSLGRWAETSAFSHRLLKHPAVLPESMVARSLWRGLAVVERGAGRTAEAEEAVRNGVQDTADECRLAIMTAQTLAVRGRVQDAISSLRQATMLCAELDDDDDVIPQVAVVASNLMRISEPQVKLAQELLVTAASAHATALSRHDDWRALHTAWYQQGLCFCLAAKPTQALSLVQQMMEREDANNAGPMERFHTAALACRAQTIRGQFKIADGAMEACEDFANRIEDPEQSKQSQKALAELKRFLAEARESA